MSTAGIIIIICIIFLLSYFFDLSSKFTKIPSVILLIALGFGAAQISKYFNFDILPLNDVLPILGTIGLILIVLNESLELELNKNNLPTIKKSLIAAVLPMLISSVLIAFVFYHFIEANWLKSIVNALPLAIISSAVAIPSVHHLSKSIKEFVIFESSISDIIGVVIFNFFIFQESFTVSDIFVFIGQIVLMLFISFAASLLLSWLLYKMDHKVKFAPILVLVILFYELSKIYHLPALIFILLFGLFLANLNMFTKYKLIKLVHAEVLEKEIIQLHRIVSEGTFLIRTMFFVVFGYLIDTASLLKLETLKWTLITLCIIYIIRAIQLRLLKLPMSPLLFVAPRGLITILLFLSIPFALQMQAINTSLILQVILLSVFIMMLGMFFYKEKKDEENEVENFFPEQIHSEIQNDIFDYREDE